MTNIYIKQYAEPRNVSLTIKRMNKRFCQCLTLTVYVEKIYPTPNNQTCLYTLTLTHTITVNIKQANVWMDALESLNVAVVVGGQYLPLCSIVLSLLLHWHIDSLSPPSLALSLLLFWYTSQFENIFIRIFFFFSIIIWISLRNVKPHVAIVHAILYSYSEVIKTKGKIIHNKLLFRNNCFK